MTSNFVRLVSLHCRDANSLLNREKIASICCSHFGKIDNKIPIRNMVSHHKCVAGCTEHASSYHKFPENPAARALWHSKLPQYAICGKKISKIKLPKDARLCSRHFKESDYKSSRTDTNLRRVRKKAVGTLTRKSLLSSAVPSIWPNSDGSLSGHEQKNSDEIIRLSTSALPSVRSERELQREIDADTISSLKDLMSAKTPFPISVVSTPTTVSFMKINTESCPPKIDYSLRVTDSFEYEVFCNNRPVQITKVSSNVPEKVNKYSNLDRLLRLLEENEKLLADQSPGEKIETVAKEIENLPFDSEKQKFLSEQVRLLEKNSHQRRYSPDILAMACMWYSVSPALYRQIQADGVLQLPSIRYVKQLSGAVTADFTLSEATVAYLKARISKLQPKDRAVNLILDEVFAFKTVQYSGGSFFGNENNKITKTLLCLMIKSVAGGYRDVVAMSPIDELNAEKIHTIWRDTVKKLTIDLQVDVVATTADNHNSNMKHFKKILCPGKLQNFIINPFDKSKKIFLLFDPTHILKCIANNFRNKECFICPSYTESNQLEPNMYPNFAHIRHLQDLETGKPVKIAHKITDKVIRPLALEKTNVSLADALFSESTINGLNFYGNNGFPEFTHTAKFLTIIRNWWDTFNVKTKYKGKHKRNEFMEAINKDNVNKVTARLKKFTAWVEEWRKEYPDFGLTSQTFNALIQTVNAAMELCQHLLNNEHIEFVLLGFLQQDYLEGRFGWYRQLAGGNYYCSVLQFLQAEKTIRLRNLVTCGFNMKEIKDIFTSTSTDILELVKTDVINISALMDDFTFIQPVEDTEITYYVAGYLARGLAKNSKCESCNEIITDRMLPLSVDIDVTEFSVDVFDGKSFIDAISRGGLTKPSDITYITCLHTSLLWRQIRGDENIWKLFLNSRNSRALFVGLFLDKLNEDENTVGMLTTECKKGHRFEVHAKSIAHGMFNMFAKNFATEKNNELHALRRRSKVDKEEKKRDQCQMKEKKVNG